ncbi:type IV pilus biogenesis/stability protein PilW [Sessilibacter corallicola]|uniref:type IV pilus biogenesis/stability protein PilW n=1 Tax=Sessilibacter corallicola TaxID=2904075 RepID=UPI001E35E9C3|nr:type IV pilus biogenesis/stability protein PilW [Sessilibacter corallicola]
MSNTSVQCSAFVILLSFFLSGCVTTTTSSSDAVVDKEKALETRIQLTLGYISQGSRDSARINLNKARDLNPNDPRVNNAAALLYQLEGEPEQAESQFKLALKKSPEFSSARNNYGVFLSSHGRNQEAYDQFEQASSNLEYDRRDVALTNLGQASLKLGLPEKAKASFEHAVRLNSRSGTPLLELAELEFKDRNYSAAKSYLDRYARVAKQNPRALWLGIRLERIFGNKDQEASLALALKNLYPYSAEYLEYKRLLDE